jgi:hypothetical protein
VRGKLLLGAVVIAVSTTASATDTAGRSDQEDVREETGSMTGSEYQRHIPDFVDAAIDLVRERYGGAWLDSSGDPTLFVAVVDPSPEDVATLTSSTPSGVDVRVVGVRYSEQDLEEFAQRLRGRLLERRSVVAIGLDVATNGVRLSLSEEDYGALTSAHEAVPKDALSVDIGPVLQGRALDTSA